jgi:multidrug efflux pump subunit AcrA (membrane-fusion protein)
MAPALKLTIVFLCAVAVLTFYSKTMYNAGIPTVHVSPVKSEKLKIEYKGEDVITLRELETEALYAPGDLAITDVFVKQYDKVEEWEALATFDVSGLENQLRDLDSLRKKLIAARDSNWDRLVEGGITQTEWRIATTQLDMEVADTERHMGILRVEIEQGRELRAPFSGTVADVFAEPGMMAGRFAPLFELSKMEQGFEIKHVIPKEMAKFFYKASVYPIGVVNKVSGTVTKRAPAPGGGIEITIELDPGIGRLEPDMLAQYELAHVTEKLPALVPVTAIHDGAFVYKLVDTEGPLGTEYRVTKVAVEAGVRGEGWASVTGDLRSGDYVVISSDKPLAGDRVKLYQE